MMDKKTLIDNQDYWNYFDESYGKILGELRSNEKYRMFWDTIDIILKHNCKLEQEVIVSKL